VVACAIERALAQTLRDNQGCPALLRICDIVGQKSTDSLAYVEAQLDTVARESNSHRHTVMACDAALALRASDRSLGGLDPDALRERVTERALERLVGYHLFGRMSVPLGPDGIPTPHAAREFKSRCIEATRLRSLARQLIADESAARLRAPRRSGRRVALYRLLSQPLDVRS
jgi:hypothetical protein